MALDDFTLRNREGLVLRFIADGGSIVSLEVPDRDGRVADVVLGYDSAEGYADDRSYLGALIGRYANRIARGRFTLDGHPHAVTVNDGTNHLHGGRRGFNKVPWEVMPAESETTALLTYTSVTGDEGYPGTLSVSVQYTVTEANEVVIDFAAVTDEPSPVNLTQHTYFNLAGHDAGDILGHELTIAGSRYTPVDRTLIPTGAIEDVTGTPFDFRTPRRIGDAVSSADEQIRIAGGIDHNIVLVDRVDRADASFAARLRDPSSGRVLEILTTEPGLQVYTGQALGGVCGKQGHVYVPFAGVALETQHFPDSPNQPRFPSTILRPGAGFTSRTVWRFSVD